MSQTLIGALFGALLAVFSLVWGFGGFLLAALFMFIGAVLGRWASGKLDLVDIFRTLIGKSNTESD